MTQLAYAGMRFGSIVATGAYRHDDAPLSHRAWEWMCDCGNKVYRQLQNVCRSPNGSCGCKTKQNIRDARTIHGDSLRDVPGFPTFIAWQSMLWRCNNKRRKDYPSYGGRGISVCERWMSYANFLNDMGYKPKGFSLDRIDVDGGYSAANCRWATATTQSNNKRNNHRVSYEGRTLTLTEWARESCIEKSTLRRRIVTGWSPARALTEPVHEWNRKTQAQTPPDIHPRPT